MPEQERLKPPGSIPPPRPGPTPSAFWARPSTTNTTCSNCCAGRKVAYRDLLTLPGAGVGEGDPLVVEQLEISAKYQGYIDRQAEEVCRAAAYEDTRLPDDLDYGTVAGLSNEVKQKLHQHRPQTLRQASASRASRRPPFRFAHPPQSAWAPARAA